VDIVRLRELLEAELSSQDLTELNEDFYREFDSLMKALKLGAESSREREELVEERLYLAQLKIAEKLMREMIRVRLHKIVDLAVNGIPYGLTKEEKKVFAVLRAFIEREELPGGEEEVTEVPEEKETPRRKTRGEAYIIKIDLPRILDEELREHGPFRAGDLAVIPRSIGEVLVKRDAAERVRIAP